MVKNNSRNNNSNNNTNYSNNNTKYSNNNINYSNNNLNLPPLTDNKHNTLMITLPLTIPKSTSRLLRYSNYWAEQSSDTKRTSSNYKMRLKTSKTNNKNNY